MKSIIRDLKVVVEISMFIAMLIAVGYFLSILRAEFFDRYYETYFGEEESFEQDINEEGIEINPDEWNPYGYYG